MTREEEIKREALSNSNDIASEVDYKSTAAYEGFVKCAMWADANPYINWQQVRIQAAIAAMQSLRSNTGYNQCTPVEIAKFSVTYADELVKELKGE
jgi:hypothetical protein